MKLTLASGTRERRRQHLAVSVARGTADGSVRLNPGGIAGQISGGVLYTQLDLLKPGTDSRFEVETVEGTGAGITVTEGRDVLTFAQDGETVTQYHYGEGSPLPLPARPYFYPLRHDGLNMTREVTSKDRPQPEIDHPHHTSLWVAHGDVNGCDHWATGPKIGVQRHDAFGSLYSGPVCAGFTEHLVWETRDGVRQVEETRVFRLWRTAGPGRCLDLEVTLKAAFGPVTLGDTKEGGLCALRVREPLQGDRDGRLVGAAGGVGEREIWGYRSPWVDYAGTLERKAVGVAILDHPKSFRHPTHWHARDYGLFAANPFAWHDYKTGWSLDGSHVIPEGGEISVRYRIYLHSGGTEEAGVREHWLNYAFPPAATL